MGSKQENTFWTKRNILIVSIVGGVLLVGLIGMTVWIFLQNQAAPDPTPEIDAEKAAAEVRRAKADGQLRDDAATQIKNKQTSAADKLYQEAIDAEQTAERKARLYLDLSGVYYAAGQYKEAFEAAMKADAVNPDKFLIADWLSRLYEDRKEYTKAAEYYTLAGQWAGSEQNHTALDKQYFQGKASEMKKLAEGGQ